MRYPRAMAKAVDADKPLDGELLEKQRKLDDRWSPKQLTGLGVFTLGLAIAIIVFMATRLTTCMYLDGSR
jgi:hypothetical protein